MILLAVFLSFGWPAEKTIWVPSGAPCPAGLYSITLPRCCGSMRPTFSGGETAYAEKYHGQPVIGFIVSDDLKTHRVVAESKTGYRTSGDANRQSDPWRNKSKLRFVIRYVVREVDR